MDRSPGYTAINSSLHYVLKKQDRRASALRNVQGLTLTLYPIQKTCSALRIHHETHYGNSASPCKADIRCLHRSEYNAGRSLFHDLIHLSGSLIRKIDTAVRTAVPVDISAEGISPGGVMQTASAAETHPVVHEGSVSVGTIRLNITVQSSAPLFIINMEDSGGCRAAGTDPVPVTHGVSTRH